MAARKPPADLDAAIRSGIVAHCTRCGTLWAPAHTTHRCIAMVEAELAVALKERDEARAFGERAAAIANGERVVTCVYCGEKYPSGTATTGAAVLHKHIQCCKSHPLYHALEVVRRARDIRSAARVGAAFMTPVARKEEEPRIAAFDEALKRLEELLK